MGAIIRGCAARISCHLNVLQKCRLKCSFIVLQDLEVEEIGLMEYTATPRPLFLYGALRALPLLALILTGDPTKVELVLSLTEPATLKGFSRVSIIGKDFPALIRQDSTSLVDGLLLRVDTHSQRLKLKNFEGGSYIITPVTATVERNGLQENVDADVYLWNGDVELSNEPWDLGTFERDMLDNWLDIFFGMELLG